MHAAKDLEAAGADFFLIFNHTVYKFTSHVSNAVSIPLLHIADATGSQIVTDKITTVGLMGTKFIVQQSFYENKLIDKFSIDVLTLTYI